MAQVPIDGSAPIVDLLQDVPSAWGASWRCSESPGGPTMMGDQPVPPHASARHGVSVERQRVEREASLAADGLQGPQRGSLCSMWRTPDASLRTGRVGSPRTRAIPLVKQFLDRLDVSSGEVRSSRARGRSAQLEEKDRLLEQHEQRVLAYAGIAAAAQSVIDDVHRSSSWRVTAPPPDVEQTTARRTDT